MTVGELIAKLKLFDQDLKVRITDYMPEGDGIRLSSALEPQVFERVFQDRLWALNVDGLEHQERYVSLEAWP